MAISRGSCSTYRGNYYVLCQAFLYVIENCKVVNTVNIILCIFQQIVTEIERPYESWSSEGLLSSLKVHI